MFLPKYPYFKSHKIYSLYGSIYGSDLLYLKKLTKRMNWLKSIFKKEEHHIEDSNDTTNFINRKGNIVVADEVYLAHISNDFDRMLKATELETNSIDRHFLLQTIIAESYKKRNEPQYKDYCLKYCEIHLKEFSGMISNLKEEFGTMPRVSMFQNYANLLTELGKFKDAIIVCETAIKYGLSDGTKGDYQGRIERIKNKSNK